jgi:serine/threonine kinase 38
MPSADVNGVVSASTESTTTVSQYTKDKANKTRLALESYYSQIINQHNERECRFKKLEERMIDEGISDVNIIDTEFIGLNDEQKDARRKQQAAKETEFLRLKRTRLTVHDFESIKVIGRGAFGEVQLIFYFQIQLLFVGSIGTKEG